MSGDTNRQDSPEVEQAKYTPEQDRSLSEAILEAIEAHTKKDVSNSDFVLYDDINPDALNELFRDDARQRTTVGFDTDDVRVELYSDVGVVINVRDRPPR